MNMQSIMTNMEKFNTQIVMGLIGAVLILLIINLISQVRISSIRKKYNKIVAGNEGVDLETMLLDIKDDLGNMKLGLRATDENLVNLKNELSYTIQKRGIIRYNALEDLGSNQSYSLTLLDKHNTGFIITSLYGRDFNASYLKPIKDGKAEYKLSKEEEESLRLALED